jgi:hypothetical protein
MNRVELGFGVCQSSTSAAMPLSGSPFACVHVVLNVPIFKLGGENLTRCFRRRGAAVSAAALRHYMPEFAQANIVDQTFRALQ